MVTYFTFENWSTRDNWAKRREAYWDHIEAQIRDKLGDEILRRRLKDLQRMETVQEALDRYLMPLVDEKGNLKLDEKTKLPLFPLEMPRMDQFLTAYLKLHERVMLLRGEATSRTEKLNVSESGGGAAPGGEVPLNEHLRSGPAIRPRISRDDARAMARAMLRNRESGPDKAAVDVEGEEVDDAADDSD